MSSPSLAQAPNDQTRLQCLELMKTDVAAMLLEKQVQYGEKGGFFDSNSPDNYYHALGEAKLKIGEFARVDPASKNFRRRLLVKAMTWLYLIYETEAGLGPKQD